MIVVAHVSDPHIDGGPRATERAERVMRHIDGLAVDAVIVTGDVADNGAPAEYEIARKTLTTRHPTLICPGNHDSREPFREVLLGSSGSDPVNQVLRVGSVSIVLVDSSIPGRAEGRLEPSTLAWLDETLSTAPGQAFVGMHHQASPLHIPYVDGIGLRNPGELAEVLERHSNVVAVLSGHAHTAAATTFAGLPLLVGPGVVSTGLTPYESESGPPVSTEQPPGFALHVYDGEHLVTHYRVVL
ncbi:metallophosphoesterase [Herbidospora sp. NBRC 101105]|uniref:metallophosphoesterase n=1 Tax=Herbidospora sp. NBRC 101105 TaxID=3032195 RepID=UPI0024A52CBF|nr:metallophosphoesterase [Herbidospora sp. NBRC 101105]GLX94888.1 3',5'-cyclic adenosine monophosphate phosphodiesterase CpdA [Herbidospora sp. NBRC 101105]